MVMVQRAEIPWTEWLAMRPELARALERHCADQHELEDMLQETYLRAALYGRLAPTGPSLRSWLIRIGMNALADWKNRQTRFSGFVCEGVIPEDVPSEEEQLAGEEDLHLGSQVLGLEAARALLQRTWSGIQGMDRAILDSVYGAGNNRRVTARECKIPERLVKGRVYRARQRLCRAMRHRAAMELGT